MLLTLIAAGAVPLSDTGPVDPEVPAGPVTLAEAKRHLRILPDDDSEDDTIKLYLSVALAHIDGPNGILARCITPQTIVKEFDSFDCIGRLPYPPFIEIVSIERFGDDRTWATVPANDYRVVDDRVSLWSGSLGAGRVRVTWRAGYDGAPGRGYPLPIKQAVLLMAEDLFRNRGEAVVGTIASKIQMALAVDSLLSPYRVWSV